MLPEVGLSIPTASLRNVVFPEPFGPISRWRPLPRRKLTSLKAQSNPNLLLRELASTTTST